MTAGESAGESAAADPADDRSADRAAPAKGADGTGLATAAEAAAGLPRNEESPRLSSAAGTGGTDATEGEAAGGNAGDVPWLRLDIRMIWADALRVLFSLSPAAIALLVVGVEPRADIVWPVVAIAVWGVIGAARDALRWVTTRYRITGTYVERRTGLFVRKYRSVQRDRIRSVDADARLLQRVVGLRRVRIGAGQVNAAMESALVLNAITKAAALELRERLLASGDRPAIASPDTVPAGPRVAAEPVEGGPAPGTAEPAAVPPADTEVADTEAADTEAADTPKEQVFSGLRWWWVFYNMFNVWAFFMAGGLLWGAYLMLTMFGFHPAGWLDSLADWEALGWGWTVAIAIAATGLLGALGMGWNFFTEHWNFRLVRLPGENGTLLRTTQGLFKTREVNRDDSRLRGLTISEPLLWRWIRMADTSVITTGLSMWSASATILPRGPLLVSRRVSAAVLNTPDSPLEAPLRGHPRAALRRRLLWALVVTGSVSGVLAWLGATTSMSERVWWITALVLGALSLMLAWAGYRALAHTITGEYVVVRSGAVSRATSALQTRAVSGVRIKQSLFQRRLGLATVSLSTAAGWGAYAAVDMSADASVEFAHRALPLGVDQFRAGTEPAGLPPSGGDQPPSGGA